MKTVTIPTDRQPTFDVYINSRKYSYPAGATVSVPDNVAAVIEEYKAAGPKYAPAQPPAQQLPDASALPDGRVLKTNGGEWTPGTDNDHRYEPLACECDVQIDENTHILIITLDKTAMEIYTATQNGKMIKLIMDGDLYTPFVSVKNTDGGVDTYVFGFVDESGKQFTSDELSAEDTVVLTAYLEG